MSKLICLNFGQAGVQMGNSLWELLCIENAISPDGVPLYPNEDEGHACTLFNKGNFGNYIPRTILIDSEPTVIDEIKTGAYRQLFNKNMMLTAKEDAANNYARGSYTIGKAMIKSINNCIRKEAEQTDYLRAFFIFNSDGGGTGSGLTPLVFLSLMNDYSKVIRSNMSVVPGSNYSSAVVEPFNVCLQNFATVSCTDIKFFYENESLYNICSKNLFINSPTYTELNRIFAIIFSCLTCSIRYSGVLRTAIDDMVTNLVPYPRIHYPIIRLAPLNHISRLTYDKLTTFDVTKLLFTQNSQTLKIDTNKGLYIAMVLNYQGLVQCKDIYKYIEKVKTDGKKFVEWCPTNFKVGICKQLPSVTPMIEIAPTDQYGTMILNSTSISEFFKRVMRKFDSLFAKKCFVHWYVGEGMEEGEFNDARNEIQLLNTDLEEISMTESELLTFANSSSCKKDQLCSIRQEDIKK